MAQRTLDHLLTRRTSQLPLLVVPDMTPGPVSERSNLCVDLGKFGNEGMVDINSGGQMADEVLEELLAGAAGRSFENSTQPRNIVAGHQLWRTDPPIVFLRRPPAPRGVRPRSGVRLG